MPAPAGHSITFATVEAAVDALLVLLESPPCADDGKAENKGTVTSECAGAIESFLTSVATTCTDALPRTRERRHVAQPAERRPATGSRIQTHARAHDYRGCDAACPPRDPEPRTHADACDPLAVSTAGVFVHPRRSARESSVPTTSPTT